MADIKTTIPEEVIEQAEAKMAEAPPITAEAARAAIELERAEREERCAEDVASVLKAHGCGIATMLRYTEDGRTEALWRVMALE